MNLDILIFLGLGFTLLNVSTGSLNTITSFQPLPQAPKTSLHWAGFSDEGSACTVDSSGMVRILSPRGYWQPICDTKTKVQFQFLNNSDINSI